MGAGSSFHKVNSEPLFTWGGLGPCCIVFANCVVYGVDLGPSGINVTSAGIGNQDHSHVCMTNHP